LNDACLYDPFPTPFTKTISENVGGKEVIIPMEFIVLRLYIVAMTNIKNYDEIEERLS
jgi:hypothetical protein